MTKRRVTQFIPKGTYYSTAIMAILIKIRKGNKLKDKETMVNIDNELPVGNTFAVPTLK